ncbi:MAG: cell envelope integrity protein TolA [Bdellovibrionota bacterium]
MFRLALGLSLALHLLTLGYLWKELRHTQTLNEALNNNPNKALSVRSVTDEELQKEIDARKRLQNTGQVVQADEQLKNEKAPNSPSENIYLSKDNQRVDRNTRAARVGKFKNVLEEGLENPSNKNKKIAGAEAVKAKKEKLKSNVFDPSNLFALATDYKESAEAKADSETNRAPASVLGGPAGGKKGQGLSATDDFLDGVAVGANTLLNTQQFKYYSFYERVRVLLVERWRTKIRSEIEKARRPASDGSSRLGLGSKITKLLVHIDPKGNISSIEKRGISGIESFDKAAEISFHEAAPFPHPPAEMLKNDELVIQWDFVVVVEDASLIKFNVTRSQ